MEPFLADLIKNDRIPKVIRDIIVIALCGFIMFIGIAVGLHSEMFLGNIFGFVIVVLALSACIYLIVKIHNLNKKS